MFAATFLAPLSLSHADQTSQKDALEAAISYNLARFTQSTDKLDELGHSPMVFCILNTNVLAINLRKMTAQQRENKSINLHEVADPNDLYGNCDITYLSTSDLSLVSLDKLTQSGSLTISDSADFLDAGGSIYLQQRGGKIAFSVNTSALKRAGKTLSSRVLQLAYEVRSPE